MRTSLAFLLVVVLGSSCGSDPNNTFCGRLGASPSCDGTAASKCLTAISSARSNDATCAPFIEALIACSARLELSCTSSSSAAVVGDGTFNGGQNFTDIGGYSVVVNDSKCDLYRRGLEACRTCPAAAGAKEVEALGIGDRCGGETTTACATGLSCQSGICTRSCTSASDCDARADDCRLQVQHPNVCAGGRCTRGCSGNFSCVAWVGSSSVCTSGACTLP